MKREYELVVLLSKAELCTKELEKIKFILQEELDWNVVSSQIFAHRIQCLSYYHLRDAKLMKYVPKEIENCFGIFYLWNNHIQKVYDENVVKILAEFDSYNVEYCILKGYVLQDLIYPAGTRIYSDIDILINNKDFKQVNQILKEQSFANGVYDYTQQKLIMTNRREMMNLILDTHQYPAYEKLINDDILPSINIDIQYEFMVSKLFKYNVDIAETIKRKRFYVKNNQKRYHLDYGDFLTQLCTHTYGDSMLVSEILENKDYRLFKFSDIYTWVLKNKEAICWNEYINKLVDSKTIDAVYFCIYFVYEIYKDLEIYDILQIFNPYITDDSFLNKYGLELGEGWIWEQSYENRIFDINHIKEVRKNTTNYIKRYSSYDSRYQL